MEACVRVGLSDLHEKQIRIKLNSDRTIDLIAIRIMNLSAVSADINLQEVLIDSRIEMYPSNLLDQF